MNTITIAESLGGLNSFFIHFLTALVLAIIFSFVYVWITPFAEFRLIHQGKVAPAISFSGALLGFVIPLASAITQSVSFLDMVVWALIAFVVQVLVFLVLRTCFSGLCRAIADNEPAPAVLLGVISLSAGLLNAACMSY